MKDNPFLQPAEAELLAVAVAGGRDDEVRSYADRVSADVLNITEAVLAAPAKERPRAFEAALADHKHAEAIKAAVLAARPDADLAAAFRMYSTWDDARAVVGAIRWCWRSWLPAGLLTMICGEQGSGKSAVALRLAGVFAAGLPWPDGSPAPDDQPGCALWLETESFLAGHTGRADKMGIATSRILTPFKDDPLRQPRLDDAGDQALIMATAMLPEVAFIVVDSLSAGHRQDENSPAMRGVVGWLAQIASETQKPVLIVHHLRKRNQLEPLDVTLDRVRGHSSTTQYARIVLGIDTPNPDDLGHKRLGVIKSNLCAPPNPLGFRIDGGGVHFCAAPEAPGRPETQLDRAVDFVRSQLRQPMPASELIEAATAYGISEKTLSRARQALKIVTVRAGNRWLVSLPASTEPDR